METQRATRQNNTRRVLAWTSDSDNDVDDVADDYDNDVDVDEDSDAMHENVVLSNFGDEEVKDLVRPTITRSGRSITRRSEIDFSYF